MDKPQPKADTRAKKAPAPPAAEPAARAKKTTPARRKRAPAAEPAAAAKQRATKQPKKA